MGIYRISKVMLGPTSFFKECWLSFIFGRNGLDSSFWDSTLPWCGAIFKTKHGRPGIPKGLTSPTCRSSNRFRYFILQANRHFFPLRNPTISLSVCFHLFEARPNVTNASLYLLLLPSPENLEKSRRLSTRRREVQSHHALRAAMFVKYWMLTVDLLQGGP